MNLTIFSKKELLATALLGLIVAGAFAMMVVSERQFSPVYDEMANIPSGINFIETGRYTDCTHPPLLRYLFSVPLFADGVDVLPADGPRAHDWHDYGRDFLFENTVPWHHILTGTRMVTILLSLLLLIFVYLWTRSIWGRTAGLVAVAFLAFEPTFLGQGQLATLDMGFALAFFGAVFTLLRYLSAPSRGNFLCLVLALGLAFLSKFTGLSLFVSTAICLFIFRKKENLHLKRFWLAPLILGLMIWGSYLFQVKSVGEDAQLLNARNSVKVQGQLDEIAATIGMTKARMLSTKIPAYDFWKGLGRQTFHAMFQDKWQNKAGFQFLNGEYSRRGWRTYFGWTFLLKSTIPTVILLLLLAFFAVRDWVAGRRAPGKLATCLALSPVILFAMISMGTINIGHRYLLPVYPFLAMGVGFLAMYFGKRMKWAVFVLLFAHILSSCAIWPHHLSYFNELSRDRFRLVDSNIDWGQDLLFLQKDLAAAPVRATAVCGEIFSLATPSDFGMPLPPIPIEGLDSLPAGPNTVYLSINHYLNRSITYPEGPFPWLNAIEPARKVGSSILVFEINK